MHRGVESDLGHQQRACERGHNERVDGLHLHGQDSYRDHGEDTGAPADSGARARYACSLYAYAEQRILRTGAGWPVRAAGARRTLDLCARYGGAAAVEPACRPHVHCVALAAGRST